MLKKCSHSGQLRNEVTKLYCRPPPGSTSMIHRNRHYQAKSRDLGDFGPFLPLKPDQSLLSHTGLDKKWLNVVVIASLTSVIW